MRKIDLIHIKTRGDLAYRQLLNYTRLESENYRPDTVFSSELNGWPGDWEGRTILGLVKLMEATHREPAYLHDILQRLPEHLNQAGFLGDIHAPGAYNEQQLSGHNWLMRGLMEYSRLCGDRSYADMARRMICNLYLPLEGRYRDYPADKSRILDGGPEGKLTKVTVSGWHLSTDTGCAFICLDGLAQAYHDLGMVEIEGLIREMIDRFEEIDLVDSSLQTHAALTAARGIMTFYQSTGEERYLALVERIFKQYTECGMTVNYANYNWFGRPLWTEPCAIVDSYILARELFLETGKPEYLELCYEIYFNALGHAQRCNGGFGCDLCVQKDNVFLRAYGESLDAYWCCSMRGAEGLAAVAGSIACSDGDRLYIAFYTNTEVAFGDAKITVTTGLPERGSVRLAIKGAARPMEIALFIPSFAAESYRVSLNGVPAAVAVENGFAVLALPEQGGVIDLEFGIPLLEVPCRGSTKYRSFQYGYTVLGVDAASELVIDKRDLVMVAPAVFLDRISGALLKPLYDTYKKSSRDTFAMQRQVLFPRRMG